MNRKNLLRKIFGFTLAALLLTGAALTTGSTVQAQGRRGRVVVVRPVRPFFHPFYPYGYPYPYSYGYYGQYVFSTAEAADSQGYHDGLKTGSDDARKNQSYNPERSHYFRDSGYGNFADAYRDGFTRGYRDGFQS